MGRLYSLPSPGLTNAEETLRDALERVTAGDFDDDPYVVCIVLANKTRKRLTLGNCEPLLSAGMLALAMQDVHDQDAEERGR
jgi:hypothetical protein